MSTKKQHYIPQMILKRHGISQIPFKKGHIWEYDRKKKTERPVLIKNTCNKRNLYELRDDSGLILEETRNEIERQFGRFESMWDKVFTQIANHNGINGEDLWSVYFFFALQMLRSPLAIKVTESYLKHANPSLSDAEANRYSRMSSFICGPLTAEAHRVLDCALSLFSEKYISILESESVFVLNGEFLIRCIPSFREDDWKHYTFFFPMSSNLCILCSPEEPSEFYNLITERFTKYLNHTTVNGNSRFIYASERPTVIIPEAL